ncbi:MAG: zinc ribbon domain-containing protein [Actinomycetota bacterium]|nr:zinc ribbon domain-containing protein [Actinomycetota bacterium]MDP3629664.1 zinc ribbon domain-containing protein [Actinomycetota bacterium]
MPAYDYKCPTCDDVFEVNRSFGDTSSVVCPVCEVEAKRLFSPVGIHFKGTGFHNTDYRAKKVIPAPPEAKGSEKAEKPAPCGGDSSPACASCPAASE